MRGGSGSPRLSRSVPSASKNPMMPTRGYSNIKTKRRVELQGRAVEDRAPDITALGGLCSPSNPGEFRVEESGTSRHTDVVEDSGLFVSQDDQLSRPTESKGFVPPPYQPLSKPVVDPNLATCFFWDRHERNGGLPGCSKDLCKFLHRYELGVPVAPAPEGYSHPPIVQKAQPLPTCYYWDASFRTQGKAFCRKGNFCMFDHFHAQGKPVAPGPAGRALTTYLSPSDLAPSESSLAIQNIDMDFTNSNLQGKTPSEKTAVCNEWYEKGSCSIRESCHYTHANIKGLPIAPKSSSVDKSSNLQNSQDVEEPLLSEKSDASANTVSSVPVCRDWATRSCRKVLDCEFRHPVDILEQFSTDDATSAADSLDITRVPPLETRNSHVLAAENYQSGAVPPMSITELRAQPWYKVPKTCNFWPQGRCVKSSATCEFVHDLQQNIEALPAPILMDGVRKIPRPCKFWALGHCKHRDRDCEFLHYIPVDDDRTVQRRSGRRGDDSPAQLAGSLARHDKNLHPLGPEVRSVEYDIEREFALVPESEHTGYFSEPNETDKYQQQRNGDYGVISQTNHQTVEGSTHSTVAGNLGHKPLTKKLSISEYHRRSKTRIAPIRVKEVSLGDSQPLLVDFGNLVELNNHLEPLQELFRLQKLRFDTLCMVHHLLNAVSMGEMMNLWTSNFNPSNFTDMIGDTLDAIYADLVSRVSGMTFVSSGVIVLVYPYILDWDFLKLAHDNLANSTRLRIAVLSCKTSIRIPKNLKGLVDTPLPGEIPARKALVKKIFSLEIKQFYPPGFLPVKYYSVYLMFPPESETEQFLVSWLFGSCTANAIKVYTSQLEGSWAAFYSTIDHGSLFLVHETMVSNISRLPNMFEALQRGTLILRSISDCGTLYPLYPSHYTEELQAPLGGISETLLAPHGQAFFIPPSLVIAEPRKVLDILDWFLGSGGKPGKLHTVTPNTWKMVTCHGFADFVLDVAVSKVEERGEFEKKYRKEPAYDQALEDKGLDFTTCKIRYMIHSRLIDAESRGLLILNSYEVHDEERNPLVYAPDMIDPNDEKMLVEWFASWSIQRLDKYRKFTVVGTSVEDESRAFRWLEEDNTQTDLVKQFTQTSIDDQVNQKDPQQSLSVRVNFIIPKPVSKSNSDPPESSRARPNDKIDRTSAISSRRGSAGIWKEVSKPKKEIIYEVTTVWYQQVQANGGGYEHISVAPWERALKQLGFGNDSMKY